MKIDKKKVAQAFQAAGSDLGLKVTSPFKLNFGGEIYEFIALIECFGTSKGTLVCSPEEWDDMGYAEIAEDEGYYCSGLYNTYEQYDRTLFVETLTDWGWCGAEEQKPSWLVM